MLLLPDAFFLGGGAVNLEFNYRISGKWMSMTTKTSTEKDTDGGVTVVCTRATTLPVLGGLVTEPELESLQR